jgi:hypothetical protein
LACEHGLQVSDETVRQWLTAEGLWRPRPRQVRAVHVWRARRECRGELVQWDTSVHAWLEDRGPEKMYLVAMIDDATSRLFARFVSADSTEENLWVLRQYIEQHGRPQAVYTDKAGLFQPTLARGWNREEPEGKGETQIGRALRELGIEWIAAHSPQAKGRIERCFGTLQDRLVKALRRAGIRGVADANRYLDEEFLPLWNERFTVEPKAAADAHRPVGRYLNLDSILAWVETRKVANDYTVQWQGRKWQIPKAAIVARLRGRTIRIERQLDGVLMARIDKARVALQVCRTDGAGAEEATPVVAGPHPRYRPAPGQSRWMDGFRVSGNDAWKAYRAEQARTVSARLRSPCGLPAPG